MFGSPSLLTRIIIGKGIGLAVGLLGFFLLPVLVPEADMLVRWGILLWYTTLGAIIGMFGVFNWHPVLNLPMPWWVRAPFLGAWMNFVLILFAYDTMEMMLQTMFGVGSFLESPFWFVAEGAIVGLIMGYFATKLGGEGKEIVGR